MFLEQTILNDEVLTPPKEFTPARRPKNVKLVGPPSFAKASRVLGKKGRGLRYQAQIVKQLEKLPFKGFAGQWFEFQSEGKTRWAQPDWYGLDEEAGALYLVEIKLTHTPMAWWQLNHLYAPILKEYYKGWKIYPIEIAGAFVSCHVPGAMTQILDFKDLRENTTAFWVIPYNGKRKYR